MNLSDTPLRPGAHIANDKTFITSLGGCDIWQSVDGGLFVGYGPQTYDYSWPQSHGRPPDLDWNRRVPAEVRSFLNAYVALHQ